MPNHYHIVVRTPLANLSDGMRHLDCLYTKYHNKKYQKDGALFRGRYKSILVDAENYLLTLSRYIHLNPIRANIVKHPAKYRWSSYKFYSKNIPAPDWLYINETLSRFGSTQQKNKYSLFIMEKTDQEVENFYRKAVLLPILGSDAFRKKISETYFQEKVLFQQIPDHKKALPAPKLLQICKIVASYYKLPLDTFYRVDRLHGNQGRTIAIYLATEMSGKKFKIIADFFKNISATGISQVVARTKKLILNKPKIANDITNLRKLINYDRCPL
jgi:hypothetical protein